MRHIAFIAIFGIGLGHGAALAQTTGDWSGLYLGGNFGWTHRDMYGRYIIPPPDAHDAVSGALAAGGQIGYQAEIDNWLFGGEAAYTFMNSSYGSNLSPGEQCLAHTPNRTCYDRIGDVFTAGFRIGRVVQPRWAVSLLGGYASGELATQTIQTSTGVEVSRTSERQNGWYIGFGADYRLTTNLFLGLDYRHVGLVPTDHHPTGVLGLDSRSMQGSADVVLARISFLIDLGTL